jgi:hypothetical protein
MTKEKFLEKARSRHGYKYLYPDLDSKVTLKSKIKIDYQGVTYFQTVNKHLLGKCPEKTTPKKTKEEFVSEARKIWKDRFDYSQTEYKNALSKVKLFDTKRSIWVDQIASLHLQGFEPKFYDTESFISESKLITDFAFTYDGCQYVNKTTDVVISCPFHGDFSVKAFNHLNYGQSCKKCDEFRFTKEVKGFLDSYRISYDRQHKFEGCRNEIELPFDFYIPAFRTCIEFESLSHFDFNKLSGGIKSFESLKTNDKIKNDYCEDNYINLIRIRYDQIDNIPQILWENLKNFIVKSR